jgi:hypothetical protein
MATLDTVATRAAGTDFPAGKAYFETSTNKFIVWNGESWIELHSDGEGAEPFNHYSLSFDGSDDYLTMSPVTPTAQQGTISGWIKVPSSHSGHMPVVTWSILSASNTFQDRLTVRNGQIRYYHQDTSNGVDIVQGGTTGLFDNTWHHVAVVCNGSSYALYLDGSAETVSVVTGSNSGKWIGDMTGTYEVTEMGASRRNASAGGSDYGNGLLDEVAVWDSALSAPEIASLIDTSGANPVPADISGLNPSAWYRMGDDSSDTFVDGGSVASITDSSGNGNTATQGTVSSRPTFSTEVPS